MLEQSTRKWDPSPSIIVIGSQPTPDTFAMYLNFNDYDNEHIYIIYIANIHMSHA